MRGERSITESDSPFGLRHLICGETLAEALDFGWRLLKRSPPDMRLAIARLWPLDGGEPSQPHQFVIGQIAAEFLLPHQPRGFVERTRIEVCSDCSCISVGRGRALGAQFLAIFQDYTLLTTLIPWMWERCGNRHAR